MVWCYYLTNCCPNNLHPWIYMIFLLPFVFEVFEVHWCFHFSRVYDHSYSCQADAERATETLAVILTLNPLEFHLWLCNVVSQSFKSCEMQLQRHLKSCFVLRESRKWKTHSASWCNRLLCLQVDDEWTLRLNWFA